jgi:hypothetical protein
LTRSLEARGCGTRIIQMDTAAASIDVVEPGMGDRYRRASEQGLPWRNLI